MIVSRLRVLAALGLSAPLLAAPPLRAQQPAPDSATRAIPASAGTQLPRGCPAGSGVWIATSSPDTARGTSSRVAGTPLDTTIVFHTPRLSWSRAWFTGLVAAGFSSDGTGGARAGGRAGGPWSVCLGIALHMQQPTLTMLNARGRVRMRADLRDLEARAPRAIPVDSVPLPSDPRR